MLIFYCLLNCIETSWFTAANDMPATATPNLIATESVVWAHLLSQVAQAVQRIIPVQRASTRIAWVIVIFGWITVTQSGTVELTLPSLNNDIGVTACKIISKRKKLINS